MVMKKKPGWNGEEILDMLQEFDEDDYMTWEDGPIADLMVEIIRNSNAGSFLADLMRQCGFDSCFAHDFPPELHAKVTEFLRAELEKRKG